MLLSNGRTLDVVDVGAGPAAVVFHHGTPGVGELYGPLQDAFRAANLRVVSCSRPGYGTSSRHRGRTVADVVPDLAEVLTERGIERFVALGWSGGGPHALACHAEPRCAGVVTLAGVAPRGAVGDGSDASWLAGQAPENVEEFGLAFAGEQPLRGFVEPARAAMISLTGEQIGDSLGELIDEPDRAVLTGEFAAYLAGSFRRGLAVGSDGWVDDDLAFCRPWGFEPADVGCPVSVWQGDADRMVPFAHGATLAATLPTATARLLPGEGHLSIVLAHVDALVADVGRMLGSG